MNRAPEPLKITFAQHLALPMLGSVLLTLVSVFVAMGLHLPTWIVLVLFALGWMNGFVAWSILKNDPFVTELRKIVPVKTSKRRKAGTERQAISRAISLVRGILLSKGHDYSSTETPWAAFELIGKVFGHTPEEVADINELQKISRLMTLRQSGEKPNYESITDSYIDKAAYAVLALAIHLDAEEQRKEGTE